jgi:hypothetical protein
VWGWKPAGMRAGSSDYWANLNFELWIREATEIARKRERKQKTSQDSFSGSFPGNKELVLILS